MLALTFEIFFFVFLPGKRPVSGADAHMHMHTPYSHAHTHGPADAISGLLTNLSHQRLAAGRRWGGGEGPGGAGGLGSHKPTPAHLQDLEQAAADTYAAQILKRQYIVSFAAYVY